MNQKINSLYKELYNIKAQNRQEEMKLESVIQSEFNILFSQDKELQKALEDVQASSNYGIDESGTVYQWIRFKANIDYNFHFLNNYLQENYYSEYLSRDECIKHLIGPIDQEIVINDSGDVFCERSCIINKEDYSSISDRNAQIESWMQEKGYYPGVFQQDRDGNISIVNTNK